MTRRHCGIEGHQPFDEPGKHCTEHLVLCAYLEPPLAIDEMETTVSLIRSAVWPLDANAPRIESTAQYEPRCRQLFNTIDLSSRDIRGSAMRRHMDPSFCREGPGFRKTVYDEYVCHFDCSVTDGGQHGLLLRSMERE